MLLQSPATVKRTVVASINDNSLHLDLRLRAPVVVRWKAVGRPCRSYRAPPQRIPLLATARLIYLQFRAVRADCIRVHVGIGDGRDLASLGGEFFLFVIAHA